MLGEILLIVGVFEILLGICFYINKNKRFLNMISEFYLALNKAGDIEEKSRITKFLGQTISLEGGMYLFLGSISIYTKMNFWIIIILIVVIEFTFFNIIKSGLRKL